MVEPAIMACFQPGHPKQRTFPNTSKGASAMFPRSFVVTLFWLLSTLIGCSQHTSHTKQAQMNGCRDIVLLHEGKVALKTKRYEQAINWFTQIIDGPFNDQLKSTAYLHRGVANYAHGNYHRAEGDYHMSIYLHENTAAYLNLGRLYSQRGFHEAAIEQYSQAVKLDLEHEQTGIPHFYRARVFFEMNKKETAVDDLAISCSLGFQDACAVSIDTSDSNGIAIAYQ